MSLASIIIPVYNGERYIAKTIESVQAQSGVDLEIIAVDDGSRDNSERIAASFAAGDSRIKRFSQPNAGIAGARNAGFAHISPSAEFVLFLDHDDLLMPGALSSLIDLLAQNESSPAAHGAAEVIDENGESASISAADAKKLGLQRRRLQNARGAAFRRACLCAESEPTSFAVFLYSNCITTVGQVLFRRRALEKTGGFDPRVAPLDDLDLYLRTSLLGSFAFAQQTTTLWRRHENNTSGNQRQMRQAYLRYWRKVADLPMPAANRRLARQMALYRFVTSVYEAFRGGGYGDGNYAWAYFRILLSSLAAVPREN